MKKRKDTAIILISLALLYTGCTASLPKDHPAGPKTYKNLMDIRVMGARRTYRVHIPPDYNQGISLPLVVVIHGAFDTAQGMEKFSGFSDLADRENFIVMYPNGMGIFGFLQHWNAGHCCGKAASDKVDDVGFVAAAIEDVRARLKIDPERIYMVGFSNGGMLVYRFAAERGDLLAAVAPLAASIGGRPSDEEPEWRIPDPGRPLSVISIHGLADDDITYEGGVSLHRGGTRTYWSVEKSIGFWVSHNGCIPRAADSYSDNGSVHIRSWGVCRNDTEVALYLLKNWGHVWPGKYFTAVLPDDDPLKNFDAAEIIWDFFKSHRRKP
ncbi:alpha/beta hydrolase family esterase [Thermodesulfobacteriota bacterium]